MNSSDHSKAIAKLKNFIESLVEHEAFLIESPISSIVWIIQIPKKFFPQVKAYVEINKDEIGEVSLVPSDVIYSRVDPVINYISDIAPEGKIFRRGM
ncbi:hypothetical protein HWA94_gp81 [Pseudomonas phage ZC08]|uniref:Uncharacterized protein n=1 Tax=Pseudomonas phage ZC08 TaxID=1622116 RepID=A0A1L2C9D5_9CAUD|nr:hypothetical protein HWA94_gp81 [Pseudomonas phage ZC08]AMD43520.1 hypothetical protein ZC08_045 [Pseudomonas phage ZC08]